MADGRVRFVIKRQATPQEISHWEEFDLRWRPGMNVITGLMDIAESPVDRFGKATTPVTYDSNCLEEVCGSCAMLINSRAAMACSSFDAAVTVTDGRRRPKTLRRRLSRGAWRGGVQDRGDSFNCDSVRSGIQSCEAMSHPRGCGAATCSS